MFSDKEFFAVFGGGMSLAFLYFICKFSILVKPAAAEIVGALLVMLQIIPFVLYVILAVLHIQMLYFSKKFMDRSVEGEFKKTFKMLNYSELITVLSVFWVFLILIDIPTFVNFWADYPSEAAKMMFFPYWLINGANAYENAILWFLPFTVLTAALEAVTYHKYFKAKHRYTNMYPSVAAPEFYNTFISMRRKKRTNLIIPKDTLADIDVPDSEEFHHKEKEQKDPSNPLGKNLGNNSLYVVDAELLGQRKNTFKTQAEIDAEEGGFFGGKDSEETMISFLPKRKANIDKKSQEYSMLQSTGAMGNLMREQREQSAAKASAEAKKTDDPAYDSEIPLDYDYQSFYRSADSKEEKEQGGQAEKEQVELITCPFCGTVNPEERDECIFCGASLEEEKNRELIPCPFCGTINPDDRLECIFCGAELNEKW